MDDDHLPAEPGPPDPEPPNPDRLIAPPQAPSNPGRGRGWTVAALVLAAILLFGTGSLVGRLSAPESGSGPGPASAASAPAASGAPNWSLLDQAYQLLRANYVDQSALDPVALQQGAIQGLMDAVNDPGHTGYLTAEEVAARNQSLSGTFVGVGAVLNMQNNVATVVRVIPGSPAEKAGLRAGESIVQVDGASVAGETLDLIVAKVRGPAGTSVTLGLQDPDGSRRDLTIVRAQLDIPLVSWAMAPGTKNAVIRLESFSTGATKDTIAAIKAARAAGAAGIVLDLRANPGGYVNEAVDVASQFLASGVVYISEDRSGSPVPHEVAGGGIATNIPLVVLVDGQTASAAEIVTGAIQDAGPREGRGRDNLRDRHRGRHVPTLRRVGGDHRDRALAHPQGPRDLARRPYAG